ncbi:MAG: acyl-CoA dehydrogenase family protein [Parvibaculaceae bacterium]
MNVRTLFSEEHDLFRQTVSRFGAEEVEPNLIRWDEAEDTGTDIWKRCGELGLLCPNVSADYGGAGADRLYSMIVLEELGPLGGLGLSMSMHSDIVARYLERYAEEGVRQAYLPEMATGQRIGALAMSEPGAGSDLKAIRTRAVRDGDDYVINGSKIFITNGYHCGIVVVVAQTDPSKGAKGISLIAVDPNTNGFVRGKKLKKIGLRSQDTAELFFNDMRVPARNLLGEEGRGFVYCMEELPWERLQIAILAIAWCERLLRQTVDYVRGREVFGRKVSDFQNTRFVLADLMTEVTIGRAFVDACMARELVGELDTVSASMAKIWCSDLQGKVADACVQLHGGYGFMREYEIGRAWADSRAQRIYGGTNEIMKDLIARSIFDR